ncbi:MAG: MBL fold metallo-hydrolase [Candidatus Aenigmarchaeota archaeon]|nr:MBL fold metallo-hydrolase [Candidatus Aenigmarchaeota archaeon]
MTAIEITFLGTTAGVPTKYRNHAALHLTYRSQEEASVLFDCGEGTQRQMLLAGLNFMAIEGIFISHWHADHFAGILGLVETMNLEGRKKPLKIYGPEAEKFVPMLEELGYSTKDFGLVPVNAEFEGREAQVLLENAELRVISMPMKHGIPAVAYAFVENDRINIDKAKAAALGLPAKGPIFGEIKEKGFAAHKGKRIGIEDISVRIAGKKVVYTGDTMPNRNIAALSADADLLIHDCTFFEDVTDMSGYKHARIDEVAAAAKEARAKKTILTHISRRYQSPKELEAAAKKYGMEVAHDFMKVVLK